MLDRNLLAGTLPWAFVAAGVAGLGFLLVIRSRRWWRLSVAVVAVLAVTVTGLITVFVEQVWRPFPDALPLQVLAAMAVMLLAVGLAIAGMRRRRWLGRALSVVAAVLVLVAAAEGVNVFYGQYPTLRSALGIRAADEIPFAAVPGSGPLVSASGGRPLSANWSAPPGMPSAGSVTEVTIPGQVSGFQARRARLYLPPSYLTSPRAQLPVLVLLAGQPGNPTDWLNGGRLAEKMDTFAAAHDGLAPVVVMPDSLGSTVANPVCVDSTLGNAFTYLSVDVPAWVKANLQVDPDPAAWAVGGLSNGGTCSLQLAVNAPAVYPTFVDLSGESEPSLGSRAKTVAGAFGGDAAAFTAVNPLDVMAAKKFPGTAGYLVAGEQDPEFRSQAEKVLAACQAAGMDAELHVLPGGHSWKVWGAGLEHALPWLATRTQLTS